MAKVSVIVSELAVTVVTEGSMSSTVAVVSAGSLRGGQEVEEIDDEAETDREAKTGRRPRQGPRAGMRGRTGRTQAHRERRTWEAAQARAGRRGHRRRQRTWHLAGASRLPPCRLPCRLPGASLSLHLQRALQSPVTSRPGERPAELSVHHRGHPRSLGNRAQPPHREGLRVAPQGWGAVQPEILRFHQTPFPLNPRYPRQPGVHDTQSWACLLTERPQGLRDQQGQAFPGPQLPSPF